MNSAFFRLHILEVIATTLRPKHMMSASALQKTIIQNAILGGISNMVAQALEAQRVGHPLTINWIPVLQFILFNAMSAVPNFLWQDALEEYFPAYPTTSSRSTRQDGSKPKLSKRNTVLKLVLDQTISAGFNTVLFSVFNRSMKLATRTGPDAIASNPFQAAVLLTSTDFLQFRNVDLGAVWAATRQDFWPVMWANWKLWPAVALINFTMVKTVQMRSLVCALAGLGWRVYLNMVAVV